MRSSICCRNKLFWVGFILVLFAIQSVALAQEDKPFESPLKKGARALHFKVVSDFSLESFEGTAISAKYHLSSSRAIRVGLSFSGTHEDKTEIEGRTDEHSTYDEIYTQTRDIKNTYYGFDFLSHYTFYSNPENRVNFFIGFGPHFGFSKDDTYAHYEYLLEWTGEDIDSSWINNSNRTAIIDNWEIGLSSIIGLDLLVTQNISLMAEYGILFDYIWTNEKENYNNDTHGYYNKTTTFSFKSNGVKLGLAVYF